MSSPPNASGLEWKQNRTKGDGVSEGGGALKQGRKRREVGAVAPGAGARGESPGPAVRFPTVRTCRAERARGPQGGGVALWIGYCASSSNHSDLDLRRSV